MNNQDEELIHLKKHLFELERQVNQLRIGRRILMNIIEKIEDEKNCLVAQLEKEKQRYRLNSERYARWLMHNNYRLMELKACLEKNRKMTGED